MSLANLSTIGELSPSQKLEMNLIGLFDWGFVYKGGYVNLSPIIDVSGYAVDIPEASGQDFTDFVGTSGWVAGTKSTLTLSADPRYPSTQIWQGYENWVYESGSIHVPHPYHEPVFYVNDIQTTPDSIDFVKGRVIFDPIVSPTAVVKGKYSKKWVNFSSTNNVDYVHRIKTNTDPNYIPETTVAMPFVTFEVPAISSSRYYGMGRQSARVFNHKIIANVFADNRGDVLKIADWICLQEGYAFKTFDPQAMFNAGDNPLNFDGTLNSAKNFRNLTELYPWVYMEFLSAEAVEGFLTTNEIYHIRVNLNTEIIGCMT